MPIAGSKAVVVKNNLAFVLDVKEVCLPDPRPSWSCNLAFVLDVKKVDVRPKLPDLRPSSGQEQPCFRLGCEGCPAEIAGCPGQEQPSRNVKEVFWPKLPDPRPS